MEAVRSTWTDERLDEFGKRVDERFDRVDQRFDEVDARFERVEDRLDRMDERFDSLHHIMVNGFIGVCATMVTGFVATFTLIATQL